MKVIKVSRCNFPPTSMYAWMNYFRFILNKKYQTVVDSKNPDVVFWTNLSNGPNEFDHYINDTCKIPDDYPNAKKVFITGEVFNHHGSICEQSPNHYAIGFENIEHPRYLRLPTYVIDCFVLYLEGRMFDTPFDWLITPKNGAEILAQKKRFCSIVQASHTELRAELFDKLSVYKPIKSSGPWRPTVQESELPQKYLYLHPNYWGRTDGLTYRSKIEFFSDCKFNIAYQLHTVPYMTQEKLPHAMAANTIPIFNGNPHILHEGFNPKSFINRHDYESVDHMVEEIKRLDGDDQAYINMMNEPWMVDNKLSQYFNSDYVLEFFERMLG